MRQILALAEIEAADDEGLDEPQRDDVFDGVGLAGRRNLAAKKRVEKACADDLLIEGEGGVPSADGLRRPLHLFDETLLGLGDGAKESRRRHSPLRAGDCSQRQPAYIGLGAV